MNIQKSLFNIVIWFIMVGVMLMGFGNHQIFTGKGLIGSTNGVENTMMSGRNI